MDWVPEFQKEEKLVAEPLPPPIPPKLIDLDDKDSHVLNNHQLLLETATITDVNDSLPVIPPKPKHWLVITNCPTNMHKG